MNKVKRLLVGMLIVGAVTAATATGTFATFNASTSNSGTVTSGTLLLGNTANGGTECISSDSGVTNVITAGNSKACDVLFTGTLNPTGSTTGFLTLKNEGNFSAASSSLAVTTCASTVNDVVAGGHTFHGDTTNAPLCGVLQVVIAQVTAGGGSTLSPSGCIYGDTAQNSPVVGCGFSNSFLASGINGGSPYALPGGALASGGQRFYRVDVNFPNTGDNRYQGQNAALTLTWTISQ